MRYSPAMSETSKSPDSRARILEAALEEFAAEGFAGARVDTIARLAGCNKQLIYHYFADKNGLFGAVLEQALSHRPPVDLRGGLGSAVAAIIEHEHKRRSWRRLMLWEALSFEDRPVIAEEERRRRSDEVIREVEQAQKDGFLPQDCPARFLILALIGMLNFPFLMPQMARIFTGMSPSDPAFRKEYAKVVKGLVERLGGRTG